jgi:hypothetical protein
MIVIRIREKFVHISILTINQKRFEKRKLLFKNVNQFNINNTDISIRHFFTTIIIIIIIFCTLHKNSCRSKKKGKNYSEKPQ